MKYLWKILSNWRKIAALIETIKLAFDDKKLTGVEAEVVLKKLIAILVEIDLIEKE